MKSSAVELFVWLALLASGLALSPGVSAGKPWPQHERPPRYATLILGAETGARHPPHRASGGVLRYTPRGPEFSYRLDARGLLPLRSYTLLYLPEPFPGQGLLCIGTASSSVAGALHGEGATDLNSDLPIAADRHKHGARIALVSSSDVDCANRFMLGWNPAHYLFGRKPIRYHDTNIPSANYSGTYCIVRAQPDSSSMLEAVIAQSGSSLTLTARGVTLTGALTGRSATLSGSLPDGTPVSASLEFADDGASVAGTMTVGSEVSNLTGDRDGCFGDYEFPAGDPQCVLPTPDTVLVVWGQQFNHVHAGVTHTGLDFKFVTALPAIVAPCDGVVVEMSRFPIDLGNVIVDVVIQYNDDWSTFIAFEPYSPDAAIADQQQAQIAVTIGQVVHRGDPLGHLVVPDPLTEFPHVHWQVYRNDAAQTPVCPRDFLAPDEQARLDALYESFGLLPVCFDTPTP